MIEAAGVIEPDSARALAGLLGVAAPDFDRGAPVPLLWHWVYLLDRPASADLAPDGHRARGGLPIPPAPGLRRMFAGGRVRQRAALRCGRPAVRRTVAHAPVVKRGRSGVLTFVTVVHEIVQDGVVVIVDEQDILYRGTEPGPDDGARTAPGEATSGDRRAPSGFEREIDIDPVLLFRFSALTYNAHRIHYDRDFARDVDGYPGLVVHGPLQAILMAAAAAGLKTDPDRPCGFEYRLVAPLFEGQGLVVSASRTGAGIDTAVRDRDGRTTARGTLASLRDERQT